MAPGSRRRQPRDRAATAERARSRIVDAAIAALKREGFAGASARTIAGIGGFSQSLIFYHFASVNDLLLAALDRTSALRMERYQRAVEEATSFPDLVRVAEDIFREDLDSGHITVLSEMIVGSSADRELGPKVVARIEPWIRFTEETVARILAGSPLEAMVPARDLAFAIVSLYLGIELLTHLSADRSRADALFAGASALTDLFGQLLGPSGARI
jgi:AcrR family transcriptional regulator